MWKFSKRFELNQFFYRVFGIYVDQFYDPLTSIISNRIIIDIIKFDEWLHSKYGNYEDNGMSMEDLVREHYGVRGVELIKDLI